MNRVMKILIASDSFKGTLTARQATDAIARGVQQCLPTATMIRQPIADGGEGTVDVVLASKPGTKHTVEVTGPLATPVRAEFAILDYKTTAVIEMAAASGLMLAPPESRDIMRATTFGTGELIAQALDLGATQIIVGLGGSATCDGGLGCAQALGVRFFDADDVEISPRAGAAMLARVRRIDRDNVHPLLSRCKVTALCDVRNPLVGASGSARIFGPQKGASPDDVRTLDDGLTHFGTVIHEQLQIEVRDRKSAGAAGGLAAGLAAFANAELADGATAIFDLIDIESAIFESDAVITGEGRLDATSLDGKAPVSLAILCFSLDRPVFTLVGQIAPPESMWDDYFDGVAEIGRDPNPDADHAQRLCYLAQVQASVWFGDR